MYYLLYDTKKAGHFRDNYLLNVYIFSAVKKIFFTFFNFLKLLYCRKSNNNSFHQFYFVITFLIIFDVVFIYMFMNPFFVVLETFPSIVQHFYIRMSMQLLFICLALSRPVDSARFDRANDLDMQRNFSHVCQKPCFCPSLWKLNRTDQSGNSPTWKGFRQDFGIRSTFIIDFRV